MKFFYEKKNFRFYFDQSERQNENHKLRFKRIVFSHSALPGSFDKIIFSVYSSCF